MDYIMGIYVVMTKNDKNVTSNDKLFTCCVALFEKLVFEIGGISLLPFHAMPGLESKALFSDCLSGKL